MTKLQYFGNTCVQFVNDSSSVLIDPNFISNRYIFRDVNQIKANIIILTHYDAKNINDVISIAKNNDSYVVSSYGVIEKLRNAGLISEKLIPVVVGQRLVVDNVFLHFIYSISNSYISGNLAMGVIVGLDDIKIYHDGNTNYYSDLKLLKDEKINYALISTSMYGSKNVDDLKILIDDISAEFFIPINYKDVEKDNLLQFKEQLLSKTNIKSTPIILSPNSGVIIKK